MTAQYKCYNSSQLWQWDAGNITSQYYLKLRGKHMISWFPPVRCVSVGLAINRAYSDIKFFRWSCVILPMSSYCKTLRNWFDRLHRYQLLQSWSWFLPLSGRPGGTFSNQVMSIYGLGAICSNRVNHGPLLCSGSWVNLYYVYIGRSDNPKGLPSGVGTQLILTLLALMPYPFTFADRLYSKEKRPGLLNVICRQIWYQRKSDYMDRVLNINVS